MLLIHGALMGAWCWEQVLSLLAEQGHDVHAIDLPGHGQDAAGSEGLRQRDYTDSVVRYCERHDLRSLTLVGHSAAGATLTLAAPLLADRLASLVFLAALVPESGQSLMQLVAPSRRAEFEGQQLHAGGETFFPQRIRADGMFLGGLSAGDKERAWSQLRPEPIGPYLEPVRNGGFDPARYDRHYLACAGDAAIRPSDQELYSRRLDVVPRRIGGGHCPMLSSPAALAATLLECMGSGEPG